MSRTKVVFAVSSLVAVVIGLAVALRYPQMAPLKDGSSSAFWQVACALAVHSESGAVSRSWIPGRVFQCSGDSFVYTIRSHHSDQFYTVSRDEVLRDFPLVVKFLSDLANRSAAVIQQLPADEQDTIAGFESWRRRASGDEDVAALVAEVERTAVDSTKKRWPNYPTFAEHVSAEERYFRLRSSRFGRYWLAALFEFIYLSALAAFVLLPWGHGTFSRSCNLHLAIGVPLFFAPYFFGYATHTFTSAGPDAGGGVLYPHLIGNFRRMSVWPSLDSAVSKVLPQPLELLAQAPGEFTSISGMGGVGPVTVVLAALAVYLVAFALGRVHRAWWRSSLQIELASGRLSEAQQRHQADRR